MAASFGVALKWVLNEPRSDKARRLRDDFKQRTHELLAPTTFVAEVGHALTRAERKGIIKPLMAEAFFSDVLSTPPDFHDFVPLMPKAIAFPWRCESVVYDRLYVALAEREQCKVVTADQRALVLFPAQTVGLDSLPQFARSAGPARISKVRNHRAGAAIADCRHAALLPGVRLLGKLSKRQ